MRLRLCCIAILTACAGGGGHSGQPPNEQTPDATVVVDDARAPLAAGTCYASSDCTTDKFCDYAPKDACGANNAIGTCKAIGPAFCPDLGFFVCGCDGATYTNECHSQSHGVAVAYGGPCRAEGTTAPACRTSNDCPVDPNFPYLCVDDPNDACDPATSMCPGICLHGAYICGPDLPCLSQTQTAVQESPNTEACMAVTDTDAETPGRCIYTTRQTCTATKDCGAGELCMPEFGCDPSTSSCPSDCVRP